MSSEENKAVVRRFLDELNKGNLAIGEELLSEDFERFLPGTPKPVGRATSQKVEAQFYAAFPDLQTTVEELLTDGDHVVARITARGTHTGAFQGIAPTGRPISMTEIFIARVQGGKITHLRAEADLFGLFQQLGATPAPAQARA